MQEADERAFLFGVRVGPDLHGLGWVGEAKAHLLGFLCLGSFPRRLHRWDLLIIFGHLLRFSEIGLHVRGEVKGPSEGEAFPLAIIGDDEVGLH